MKIHITIERSKDKKKIKELKSVLIRMKNFADQRGQLAMKDHDLEDDYWSAISK